MSLIDEFKNDAHGVMLLKDWLGEGGEVVSQQKADHRASICCGGNMGMPCPNNVEPHWWDRVKSAIADVIREQLSIKHKINVGTRFDEGLHMCKSCGCCLKLKVHTPISHIKEHTNQAAIDSMPDFCWMKKELKP